MRLNIFKNRRVDAQVAYLLDTYDQALRNRTEQYWRKTIAEEIYDSCPENDDGYPCEDCFEFYEFVMSKVRISHDF